MSETTKNKWLYSIAGVLAAAAAGLFLFTSTSRADLPEMTVYRSAACGCCGGWVDVMEEAGFEVEVIEDRDVVAVKDELGVPPSLHSCHSAVVGAYVVEGHVPAADVKRLLREEPRVKGVSVPGMVKGSPGMPGVPEPYAVATFTATGSTNLWARH
jgi:hypothetical protein